MSDIKREIEKLTGNYDAYLVGAGIDFSNVDYDQVADARIELWTKLESLFQQELDKAVRRTCLEARRDELKNILPKPGFAGFLGTSNSDIKDRISELNKLIKGEK